MFPEPGPRLFALPPGVDFAACVVRGLEARLAGQSPEAWAEATLVLNTRRMQRRVRGLLSQGPARLLPRMRLVTDWALDPLGADLPVPVPPLRRRLELARLIAGLLDADPGLAPRAALFDLADSLAGLLDEMAGEGVSPQTIASLDVTDLSGHWERSLRFLTIARQWQEDAGGRPDREERQRAAVLRQIAAWEHAPPARPVIVAGSTGSRGATALLLAAVARLPQGAVILPGFDLDMPEAVWAGLRDARTGEDHPQFRFRRLLDLMGLTRGAVRPWPGADPADPARNRLISLSLRPAPVTDQWLTEGPGLGPLEPACAGITLVEAQSPRAEAEAIALRLRAAVDEGRTAALITADRGLSRQVAAALDRWQIVPDDSAGVPLALSPPGRLLRQVADLMARPATGEALLSVLKHPLVTWGERGDHLRHSRDLELRLRRKGPAWPDAATLRAVGGDWADWVAGWLEALAGVAPGPLPALVAGHLAVAGQIGGERLWQLAAGRAARQLMDDLSAAATAGPDMTPQEYAAVFAAILATGEVRDRDQGHPQVLFWGTIEARVGGADLVILGGLNEGSWPEAPPADPWLNRALRLQAGLLLPERRIGLSAHDYQQAIAAPEVWITRALRDAEAQTVPSRWVNRLTNLLDGLPDTGGRDALAQMRGRGQVWLDAAAGLSRPDAQVAAPRPAPRPPLAHRPTALSVTDIGRLYRNPYHVYAARVLRLRPLDPLMPNPDALMRGTVLHKVLEEFIGAGVPYDPGQARDAVLAAAERVLRRDCPWPTVQRMWLASVGRWADWFLLTEAERRQKGQPVWLEQTGDLLVDGTGVTLTGRADRIDETEDGRLILYDYKTGEPPTKAQQLALDKQLLIEAAMAERGAFRKAGPAPVLEAVYIGLGPQKQVAAPLADQPPDLVWAELQAVLRLWQDPARGYVARRAAFGDAQAEVYDRLSRFGEWDVTDPALPEDMA